METEITFLEKPKLNEPILIVGLPGVGNVGRIAVSYLAEKLEAKKFAQIHSPHMFPLALVSPKNEISCIGIDLYYFSGKQDIVFVIGDSQPIDYDGYYAICDKLLEFCKNYKVKEIITTGGFGLGYEKPEPRVLGALINQDNTERLKNAGVSFEKENPIGSIFGISGLLLSMSKRKNIDGFCLLGETIGYPILTDPKSAEAVLKVLMKLFDLNVDLKDIDKRVQELEQFLKAVEDKTKDLMEKMKKPTKSYSEYIA